MPSLDSRTTIARQWELLRNHIPSRPPGITTRELQDRLRDAGHEVTKRTIERDLRDLSPIFAIECNDKSVPYGWHWHDRNACADILGLDVSEAVSLGLLENVLSQLMPPAFAEALEGRFAAAKDKLTALKKLPHARWNDLVRYVPPGIPQTPPVVGPGVLSSVQEALLQNKQLAATYRNSAQGTVSDQTLHPLSLIQHGTRSYLVASAFDYDSPILYALHRFGKIEVLTESAKRPKDYSLDQFLADGRAQFGNGQDLRFKARITPELAQILDESPIAKDQKLKPEDDSFTLTATLKDSWEFTFWILSQSAGLTVLKPAALRRHIKATLQASLERYQDD